MQHLRPIGQVPDAILLAAPDNAKGKSKEIVFGEKVTYRKIMLILAWNSKRRSGFNRGERVSDRSDAEYPRQSTRISTRYGPQSARSIGSIGR